MTDENNSGSGNGADWIQAWIEQQREQLRRAGAAVDESADRSSGGAGAASNPVHELGMRWLEAGQSYLQGWQQFAQGAGASAAGGEASFKSGDEMFNAWQHAWVGVAAAGEGAVRQFADLIARMPALGLAREQNEMWRELLAAQAECQQLEQELRAVWIKVQGDALSQVESMLRERRHPQGIDSYRELYDLWVECGERVFAGVAHSEAYAKLQAQAGNAIIQVRAKQQAVIERALKYFDLPTRSELNTVHKQRRERRERVATLESQLAETRERGRS